MRLHGDREPRQPQHGSTGGAICRSGAPNEIWSFGPDVYAICAECLRIRESLRDYIRSLMREAHETGAPVIRTLFWEFPDDEACWGSEVEGQFMFGSQYLVVPIMKPGAERVWIYFPRGSDWECFYDASVLYYGGQKIDVPCPIERMPVFRRITR